MHHPTHCWVGHTVPFLNAELQQAVLHHKHKYRFMPVCPQQAMMHAQSLCTLSPSTAKSQTSNKIGRSPWGKPDTFLHNAELAAMQCIAGNYADQHHSNAFSIGGFLNQLGTALRTVLRCHLECSQTHVHVWHCLAMTHCNNCMHEATTKAIAGLVMSNNRQPAQSCHRIALHNALQHSLLETTPFN
jgi:hypothetical protein